MFGAFQTFGKLGAAAGRTLAQQIAAMSPSLWLEPSVTSGYQDSAGTTALTQPGAGAADPPVGKVLDLSGLGNHATQSTSTARPKLSARVNLLTATDTLSTQSVTVSAVAHTINWSGAGTITASGAYSGALSKGQTFTPSAGTLTLTVSGSVTSASLVLGSSVGTYQAVTDANTYDSAGFPLYWKFDGTDDWLATGNIDLTGTDKVTVVAGVMKASDYSSYSIVAEFSADSSSVAGSFALMAPWNSGLKGFGFDAGGTTRVHSTNDNHPAPINAVLTGTSNISAPSARLDFNGADGSAITTSQGAGNYSNSALNIGRRAGGTLAFNGNIYALLIFPRILTAAEIAIVERYVAQKSGVTL